MHSRKENVSIQQGLKHADFRINFEHFLHRQTDYNSDETQSITTKKY